MNEIRLSSTKEIKMKKAASLFFVSLVGLMLIGCSTATESSDSVDQDKVHQSYFAKFSSENNRTSIHAGFRFGDGSGTTLRLVGKSNVTHNAFALKEVNMAGTFYQGDGAGFQADHAFTWVDTAGKQYVNRATIKEIAFGAVTPATLSRARGGEIPFIGAIQPGETVKVVIHDQVRSLMEVVSSRHVGETKVVVETKDLTKFFDGKVTLKLERFDELPLQQGTSRGGGISTSYSTLTRDVWLVP
jgi:hypothetical protein